MKRFLSMLLAITMLLSLTSTMVFAEEPEYGVEEPGTTEGDDFDVGFGELVDPIPGATPETAIEIGRVDWSVVAMNYNQTAPVEMTYTTTIPYGATRYFTSQNIAGYELTVGEEEIAATGNPMTGFSFNVTNNNEESEEVVITAKLPLGTMMNPERVTELGMMDVTVPAGAVDGYYYVYNAPAEGTVTLYINSWTVPTTPVETTDEEGVVTTEEVPYTTDMVVTRENGQVLTLSQDGVDNYGLELVLEVAANEQLIIQVVAADDGVDTAYPEASFGWVGSFAYPAGTVNNPINIEWEWNDTYTTATATVTVPAGQTQYFIGNEAMILTANGNPVEQSETGVFSLTEGEYALVMETPVGAQANPEVIEEMDGYTDTVALEADAAYYYIWTATEDGTVTLDVTDGANITVDHFTGEMSEDGWPLTVQYELAEAITDENYNYTGWNVAENVTIEVTAGQQLKIQVNALTDWSTWTTPAIEYTLTGAFQAAAVVEPTGTLGMRGMTVSLRDLIMIGYKFTATSEQEIVAVGGLLWLAEDYEAETDHTINSSTVIVKEANIESGSGASAIYRVNSDGILAQNLDTKYYFVPYIQTEHGYVYGNAISPTVLNYCTTALAGKDENLKSLIIDLLNYATAAREYFCISEGLAQPATPFNSILTDEQKVVGWGDNLKASAPTYDTASGGFNPAIRGIVCNLGEAISLKVNFASTAVVGGVYWNAEDFAANSSNLTVDNATGEMELSVDGSISTVKVGGLYAFNIYDYYYMRAYDASANTTRTYGTSVAAYLTSQINSNSAKTDSASVALVALCQAMLVYGNNAATNPSITK